MKLLSLLIFCTTHSSYLTLFHWELPFSAVIAFKYNFFRRIYDHETGSFDVAFLLVTQNTYYRLKVLPIVEFNTNTYRYLTWLKQHSTECLFATQSHVRWWRELDTLIIRFLRCCAYSLNISFSARQAVLISWNIFLHNVYTIITIYLDSEMMTSMVPENK